MSKPTDYAILIGVGAVAILVLGFVAKKQAAAAVAVAGGIVSGNNALTAGTPYQGWGILGTLGAATNSALGGMPETFGEWLGGKTYDVFH